MSPEPQTFPSSGDWKSCFIFRAHGSNSFSRKQSSLIILSGPGSPALLSPDCSCLPERAAPYSLICAPASSVSPYPAGLHIGPAICAASQPPYLNTAWGVPCAQSLVVVVGWGGPPSPYLVFHGLFAFSQCMHRMAREREGGISQETLFIKIHAAAPHFNNKKHPEELILCSDQNWEKSGNSLPFVEF